MRTHRARQEIASERDRLVKRADHRIDLQKFLPRDGKDRARATLITALMCLFGMVPYVVMILMWFLLYHSSFVQTVVAFATLIAVGALFAFGSTKRALGKDRPWMWWFGLIWNQAAVVGLVVGFFLYYRDLAYYLKYEEMRTYTNVAAAQESTSFGDGSMFLFTEDSRLDSMRSVGYKSRWTGDSYCVAPLVDLVMQQEDEVQYWAVGINCCNARALFQCDDAEDFQTRSALRVLGPEDVARPFMQWAVRGDEYPRYASALALEEAVYNIKASKKPVLVRWTKNPIALKDSFYNSAKDACISVSIGYFVLVLVSVYFVAWKLLPRQRHEGVIRG